MSKATKQNIIIATILIILSVSGFGFMIKIIHSQGERLVAQITAVETQRSQSNSRVQLQRTADNSVSDREQLEQYFLQRPSDSINFLNWAEATAPKLGVSIESKSLEPVETKDESASWIEVKFTLFGTEESIFNFIKVLETVPYASRLVSVETKALSSEAWQADVSMQIRVMAYDQ